MENMPLIVQIIILIVGLYGLPAMVGCCLKTGSLEDFAPEKKSPVYWWITGQMLLWAVFQIVCVPHILLEKRFYRVVEMYGAVVLFLGILGLANLIRLCRGRGIDKKALSESKGMTRRLKINIQSISRLVFGGLLVFQLIQAVRLAYGDGDDAYYVAVSTITQEAETMYRKLPYTGGSTNVDIRHGLAPFPIWIAFWARISGMEAVSVAHVVMPLVMIPMTYGIFWLIGKRLWSGREKWLPCYMVFTAILVLFGDYSMYTAERFMLARSRQGKAALGSAILPMLIYLMFVMLDKLQEDRKHRIRDWILLSSVMFAGCLCSTMGGFLLCMMVALTGICALGVYRKWKVLIPLAVCCLPCAFYVLIYAMN